MDVAIDASGVYVVGYDSSRGQRSTRYGNVETIISDHQWRIEKRSLTDGKSIWNQTSNHSDNSDEATDIVIDASGVYVVGFYWATSSSTSPSHDRIMKISPSDGKLIWIQRSTDGKVAKNVALDASGIFLVGPAWRIVKRSVSTGSTQDDSVDFPFYIQTWFYVSIIVAVIAVSISIFILRRKRATTSNLRQPTLTQIKE